MAMVESLKDMAKKTGNAEADVLGDTLTKAIGGVLDNRKSPSRTKLALDNRGSHFYCTLYWAEALAKQTDSVKLQQRFESVAKALRANEAKILGELLAVSGQPQNIGGYYRPDPFFASQAMRPSPTFNLITESLLAASEF